MDIWIRYCKRAFKLPFKVLLHKGVIRLQAVLSRFVRRLQDRQRPTYRELPECMAEARLLRRFKSADFLLQGVSEHLRAVTDHYLNHRFDLLGSGWLQVSHGMHCYGLEGISYNNGEPVIADPHGEWLRGRVNPSNLAYAQYVWSLVTPGYLPIDWHLDFKSGYRWSESVWYKDIRFGDLPGVDVKVPWELARMQHLPQLARAYAMAVAQTQGFRSPKTYTQEFQNQVLDFIATNPPRYGVNWWCAMDVGIRVSNWLMAYDLFVSVGAVFDEEFNRVFCQSVYQHGQHIVSNLEWHPELRNNHYLGDIVGLLFVAAYLPCSAEIDAWLAFAVQELLVEVKGQFYEDGGNFEASTSYHRLSAEMVVYATALIVGLPENKYTALASYDEKLIECISRLNPGPIQLLKIPGSALKSPFPEWYWHRLEKMAEFTNSILRPDNLIPQIGDNDSGRFFKIYPRFISIKVSDAIAQFENLKTYNDLSKDDIYWLEIHNDHRHLIAAINGFFKRKDFLNVGKKFVSETHLIECLGGGCSVVTRTSTTECRDSFGLNSRISNTEGSQYRERGQRYVFHAPDMDGGRADLTIGLKCDAYPQFGLYIYKSPRLYLSVRCGSIGLKGLGAHAHNDSLSIELWIDGKPLIVDPGSYIYTPLPMRRNAFRSIKAHFAPSFTGVEPGNLNVGVFALGNEALATCISHSDNEFYGSYYCGVDTVFRAIRIDGHMISIDDWSTNLNAQLCRLDSTFSNTERHLCSDGYGWLKN